ncbi:MAG TPA: hypothetical protein VMU34_15580 [Mycobacterium sp.]|nr:hypothetical protein [Mycobacterium sp.]
MSDRVWLRRQLRASKRDVLREAAASRVDLESACRRELHRLDVARRFWAAELAALVAR